MNNAKLYSNYGSLQKRDAAYILDEYFHYVRWRPDGGDLVLDVGCGSGEVTAHLMLPRIPASIQGIVGADISAEMVAYAAATHRHPKLQFEKLNIATNNLPAHVVAHFDHIVSFNCLNWVQNQRKAFENMYNILGSNGDFLVTFHTNNVLFAIYEAIANIPQWRPYMMDVKLYVTPYQHSSNPTKEIQTLLEEIGFDVKFCETEPHIFIFNDIDEWKGSLKAVNPFLNRIPDDLKGDFIKEFIRQFKKNNLFEEKNNQTKIAVVYDLLIIYARKSFQEKSTVVTETNT